MLFKFEPLTNGEQPKRPKGASSRLANHYIILISRYNTKAFTRSNKHALANATVPVGLPAITHVTAQFNDNPKSCAVQPSPPGCAQNGCQLPSYHDVTPLLCLAQLCRSQSTKASVPLPQLNSFNTRAGEAATDCICRACIGGVLNIACGHSCQGSLVGRPPSNIQGFTPKHCHVTSAALWSLIQTRPSTQSEF